MKNFFAILAALLTAALEPGLGAAPAKPVAPLTPATPLEWSQRLADSEMLRLGNSLHPAPAGRGRWDYTTGLYADALIRLSEATGNPAYEKNAEATIGSFIGFTGTIETYQGKHMPPGKPAQRSAKPKPKPKPKPSAKPGAAKHGSPTPTPKPKPKASPSPSPGKKKPNPKPGPKARYSLDEVQSGVATLKLYDITREVRFRWAADILRRQLSKHPRNKEGGFWHKGGYPDQMWLDGLYMGEPFYAAYAVRFHEPRDFDDIAHQFLLVGQHTYDPETGLFYHGWDESKKQPWANPKTGNSPNFWSRSIGWYAMGLVDVLPLFPADHPARPALVRLFRRIAAGIVKYQDPDTGVWWQVTNEGGRRHNYREASASCMFVYALAKGVNEGYLPRSYVPAIRRGYAGILKQFVRPNPKGQGIDLTRVCMVAVLDPKNKATYHYYTRVPPIVSNDLKGVGPFINAGIECEQLFGAKKFGP